jgi:uncharacterized membrane protein
MRRYQLRMTTSNSIRRIESRSGARLAQLAAAAAGLGFVAGLRSQMPLRLLAVEANRDSRTRARGALRLFDSRPALFATGLTALSELVVDKLPFVPDRIDPLPLAGRLFFGGLAGGAVFSGGRKPFVAGAGLGAAAAALGSYAGYSGRTTLGKRSAVPNVALGMIEDVVAFTLGGLTTRWVETGSPRRLLPNVKGRRGIG